MARIQSTTVFLWTGLLIVSVLVAHVSVAADNANTVWPDAYINVTATLKPGWTYTIQSPGFPDNYPLNTTYIWNITGPYGYYIYLILDHFQIEPSRYCENDYLTDANSFRELFYRRSGYCSVLSPNYIKSLTPAQRINDEKLRYGGRTTMWLKFSSDESSEFKGFRGQLRVVGSSSDDRGCQNYLNDTSGSFSSPKHPLLYPRAMSCTWRIAVPDGFRAKLTFTAFELENTKNDDDDCIHDYVEIREGVWGRYGELLGRFCGDVIPPDVISPSNQMWVRFTSDRNATTVYKGFRAEFSGSDVMMSHGALFFIISLMTSMLLN